MRSTSCSELTNWCYRLVHCSIMSTPTYETKWRNWHQTNCSAQSLLHRWIHLLHRSTALKKSTDTETALKQSTDTETVLKQSTDTKTALKQSTDTQTALKQITDTETTSLISTACVLEIISSLIHIWFVKERNVSSVISTMDCVTLDLDQFDPGLNHCLHTTPALTHCKPALVHRTLHELTQTQHTAPALLFLLAHSTLHELTQSTLSQFHLSISDCHDLLLPQCLWQCTKLFVFMH